MKLFYLVFQLLILAILIVSSFISVTLITWDMTDMISQWKLIILSVTVLIQFLLINVLIKFVFYSPILELKNGIFNFLNWNLKNKDIIFEKTFNSDIDAITSFFSKTLNILKNIKDEFLHGKEIKSEVDLWKEIQWKMLTKKVLEVPELDIIIKSKPAWEIWWDSYDIIKSKDNFYIYVWDATGHWVWAWFIMMMVNSLVSWFSWIFEKWNEILAKTNEILKPRVKANLLMSMLLVRWDAKQKRMFMTWAGHEYLMIYKASKKRCFRIKSWWVALWMIKDITKLLKEQEIKFEENDIIVLYSDWITEAINKSKKDGSEEMFWEDRLQKIIEKSPVVNWKTYKSARSVFNNITIELSKFMWYKHFQFDDITLWVIHYKWKDFDIAHDYPKEIKEDFITEWNW